MTRLQANIVQKQLVAHVTRTGPEGPPGINTWGSILGNITDQLDLQTALNLKANISSLSPVALSGNYNDLLNLPTLDFLPLSGGTITGNLSVNGNVDINGLTANNGGFAIGEGSAISDSTLGGMDSPFGTIADNDAVMRIITWHGFQQYVSKRGPADWYISHTDGTGETNIMSAYYNRVEIKNGGYLQIAGGTAVINNSSGDALTLDGNNANTLIRFKNNGAERAAIFSLNGQTTLNIRSQAALVLTSNNSTTARSVAINNGVIDAGTNKLGVGTSAPSSNVHVIGSNISADNADMTAYALGISIAADSNHTQGIAFRHSSAIGGIPGAAIVFSRTGMQSVGDLVFKTKTGTGSSDPLATRLTIKQDGTLLLNEGSALQVGTTVGTKIGTASAQKLGFWNANPVVQQVLATGAGATVDNVISLLQTLGLCKQS